MLWNFPPGRSAPTGCAHHLDQKYPFGELAAVAGCLVSGGDLRADELTAKHADWAEGFRTKYDITPENVMDIVRSETGLVFAQVLEHAGVYKRTPEGRAAFLRFLETVK